MSVTSDFRLHVEVKSDTGLERSENQDQLNRFSSPFGEVLMVADGMGGYQGGATAARMVVEGYQQCLTSLDGATPYAEALLEATRRTAEAVYRLGKSGDPRYTQMGSTVVMALLRGRDLVTAHIGDSRAYLFRDGKLRRLTRDHTRLQPFIDSGQMTEAEARDHPDSSVLSRVIGHTQTVDLEISEPVRLEPGDGILLCSDGLSGYVEDAQIEAALRKRCDKPQQVVERLIKMALDTGGHDNVTIEYAYVMRDATVLLPAGLPRPRTAWRRALPLALLVAAVAAGAWFVKDRRQQAPPPAFRMPSVETPPANGQNQLKDPAPAASAQLPEPPPAAAAAQRTASYVVGVLHPFSGKGRAGEVALQLNQAKLDGRLEPKLRAVSRNELIRQMDIAYRDEASAAVARQLSVLLKTERKAVEFTEDQKKKFGEFEILVLMPRE